MLCRWSVSTKVLRNVDLIQAKDPAGLSSQHKSARRQALLLQDRALTDVPEKRGSGISAEKIQMACKYTRR